MTATFAPPVLPLEAGDPHRLVTITVNLLPEEILAARAGRSARRLAIVIMAIVAVCVGGWTYHAHQGAVDAAAKLKQQNAIVAAQAGQLGLFKNLNTTKSGISSLREQVVGATKGGIAWNDVISRVRQALPAHVGLTGITATATPASPATTVPPSTSSDPSSSTAAPASGTTSAAADAVPGTLILTGTAATKQQVSAFSNHLAVVTGLSNPIVTAVQRADKGNGVTFSLQVNVTTKALSTRYDSKAGR